MLEESVFGNGTIEVIIKPSYEELCKYVGRIVEREIRRKPNLVLGLPTGKTPEGLYKELIRMHKEESLDFSKVTTFNLDEYFGVGIDLRKSAEEDQSYARFMHERLFRHINLPEKNRYVPDGRVPLGEIAEYCLWYENEMKKLGGIYLQILGIGKDCHIGFNEPGSSLESRTRLVPLDETTINVNWERFYKNAGIRKEDMPQAAITMGIATILDSKYALLLASGSEKADIVAEAIEGPITSQKTASFLQLHKNLGVIIDEEAAGKLERYKHYKHVQELKEKLRK